MTRKGYVGRDPDAPKRTERALREIGDKLNDLTRSGEIFFGNDGKWHLSASDASAGTPPFFNARRGERSRPFFFPGIQGDTGPQGPTGPSGSGGSGGDGVPPPSYLRRRRLDVWLPPGGIDSLYPPGGTSTFLRGDGTWASPGAASSWDVNVVTTGDEDVTNSTTLTDHSTLQHSVTAGSIWWYEHWWLFSGTAAAGDIKMNWTVAAGTFNATTQFQFLQSTTDTYSVNQIRTLAAANWSTTLTFGTDAAGTLRFGYMTQMIEYSNSTTAKFQFAQNGAGVGTKATIRTGTTMRAKRIL